MTIVTQIVKDYMISVELINKYHDNTKRVKVGNEEMVPLQMTMNSKLSEPIVVNVK